MKHIIKLYCKDYENIENYEKAKAENFVGWHCHHRLQTWTLDGERRDVDVSRKELKALGLYYNRPAEELIFLTAAEHMSLHNKGKTSPRKGKKLSEETRNKISETLRGHPAWNKGKKLSEEHRQKLSEVHKGRQTWMKGKCHSEKARKRISEAKRGRRWFNDGSKEVFCFECPEGFVPGRLINKKINNNIYNS